MSAVAIWIICVVVVVAIGGWLGSVFWASRKPHQQDHAHGEQLRGQVQGGMHVGGGRSVAPRRDEAVVPDEALGGDSLHPEVPAPRADAEPGQVRPGSPSPLDL
jgi:hypothetical protein